MSGIAFQARLRLGDFRLDAAFTGADRVTALFGPSGAGKSTILRLISGLLRPDEGRIVLAGRIVFDSAGGIDIPARRRRVGLVFQDGLLFPHMSVRQNLLYSPWVRRLPRPPTFDRTVEMLDIGRLLDRAPRHLSGGERQRVAIGRALLSQPKLLLMDEPLASLDGPRRAEFMPYLLRLRDRLKLPVLYVTHSTDEMIRLADHVVLLKSGSVAAAGPIDEIAARVDLPLAALDDAAGVLEGYLHSHDIERRLSAVASGGQIYMVPQQDLAERRNVRLRIPAREVILSLDAPREISVNNIIPATVLAVGTDEATHAALVEIDVAGGILLSRVTLDAAERLRLREGTRVLALIKSVSIEVVAG
jgi:molybdate transport system ATP-binding protein